MRWYEGDIEQGVTTSKSKNAVFVVYVEGKDDKSKNLTLHLNDPEVSSKLESGNFVAIKVEAGSVLHTQFAAIYNNVPVPSLFFIGKNGKPVDIITDSASSDALATRINTVIATHTGVPVQTTSAAKQQSDALLRSEKQPVPVQQQQQQQQQDKRAEPVCENGACAPAAAAAGVPSASVAPVPVEPVAAEPKTDVSAAFLEQEKQDLSREEKVDRAKQLVEQKREEKRQQEEEEERKREMERRRLGQEVQKMQRSQQDQELKNLMEERQRAKNEEKAARDRILAQIAQDKADRVTRFAPSHPAPAAASAASSQAAAAAAAASSQSNANVARLQFRLPDGTSHTHEFEASATLGAVRDYIAGHVRLPFRHFSLSTTFPRREFSDADGEATMRELQLCPNAVILVLAAHASSSGGGGGGGAVSADGGGGLLSILWLLFTPFFSIFDYFRSWILGAEPADGTAAQPPERNKATTGGGGASGQPPGESEGSSSQAQQPQPQPTGATKRKAADSTVVRRQGNSNIHRLSDRTESDDDNNTWNGNSTQQM